MRRYALAPQFLRDFRTLESGMSPADEEIVDKLMAADINDPQGVERIPSFYDPHRPSWLARADPFVVHFAYDAESDEVIFLNLFRRR